LGLGGKKGTSKRGVSQSMKGTKQSRQQNAFEEFTRGKGEDSKSSGEGPKGFKGKEGKQRKSSLLTLWGVSDSTSYSGKETEKETLGSGEKSLLKAVKEEGSKSPMRGVMPGCERPVGKGDRKKVGIKGLNITAK